MSPDLKRKYELAVGEGRYDIVSEVRDVGDRRITSPKSFVGRSGALMAYLIGQVDNLIICLEHSETLESADVTALIGLEHSETLESADATATIGLSYETEVV